MDRFSFRLGNVMLGNHENDAAFEITLQGPDLLFQDERCVVLTGADLGMMVDGAQAEAWTVHRVRQGGRVSIGGNVAGGSRAYLCLSGGVDVPLVMGSRSTYSRAGIGGYNGRALKEGDIVGLGEPRPLWRRSEGLVCPLELRPAGRSNEAILVIDGPQIDAFTGRGIAVFLGEPFTITGEIDRMGYRLDGPAIEHKNGPDIVSDGIVHGSVQVPGDGKPIVTMSDCHTIGGYANIAVVISWSAASLARMMPGDTVRFKRVTEKEAVGYLEKFEEAMRGIGEIRAAYRSRRG
jgi:biotin-dependent carboxylase-like uncharacterized protein